MGQGPQTLAAPEASVSNISDESAPAVPGFLLLFFLREGGKRSRQRPQQGNSRPARTQDLPVSPLERPPTEVIQVGSYGTTPKQRAVFNFPETSARVGLGRQHQPSRWAGRRSPGTAPARVGASLVSESCLS